MSDGSPWGQRIKALEDEWFAQAERGIKDTHVYRYFDEAGTLLYVGQTGNPDRRHNGHRSKSEWFPLIARREVRGPVTKAWALFEEYVALGLEHPRYNNMRRNGHAGPGSDHWDRFLASEYRRLMDSEPELNDAHMGWLADRLDSIFAKRTLIAAVSS